MGIESEDENTDYSPDQVSVIYINVFDHNSAIIDL